MSRGKGFSPKYGINYTEIYPTIVKHVTLRMVIDDIATHVVCALDYFDEVTVYHARYL